MYFPMGSPMLGSKSAVLRAPILKKLGITKIAECGIVLYKSV